MQALRTDINTKSDFQPEPLFGTTALIIGFFLGVIPGIIMLIANAFSGSDKATMDDLKGKDRVQQSPPRPSTIRKVGTVTKRPSNPAAGSHQKEAQAKNRSSKSATTVSTASKNQGKIEEFKERYVDIFHDLGKTGRLSSDLLSKGQKLIEETQSFIQDRSVPLSERQTLSAKMNELQVRIANHIKLITPKDVHHLTVELAKMNRELIEMTKKEQFQLTYDVIGKYQEAIEMNPHVSGMSNLGEQLNKFIRRVDQRYEQLFGNKRQPSSGDRKTTRTPLKDVTESQPNPRKAKKKKASSSKKSTTTVAPAKIVPSKTPSKTIEAFDLWLEYQDAYSKEAIQQRKPAFIRDLSLVPKPQHNDTYVQTLKQRFGVK